MEKKHKVLFLTTLVPTKRKSAWTETQDKILTEKAKEYQYKHWSLVAKHIPGKTGTQCSRRINIIKRGVSKGAWSVEEDKKLIQLFNLYGRKWVKISEKMQQRTDGQIRDRYVNYLDPNIKKSKFTKEEDATILKWYKIYKHSWVDIAKKVEGRTCGVIKKRFYSTLRYRLQKENCYHYEEGLNSRTEIDGEEDDGIIIKNKKEGENNKAKENIKGLNSIKDSSPNNINNIEDNNKTCITLSSFNEKESKKIEKNNDSCKSIRPMEIDFSFSNNNLSNITPNIHSKDLGTESKQCKIFFNPNKVNINTEINTNINNNQKKLLFNVIYKSDINNPFIQKNSYQNFINNNIFIVPSINEAKNLVSQSQSKFGMQIDQTKLNYFLSSSNNNKIKLASINEIGKYNNNIYNLNNNKMMEIEGEEKNSISNKRERLEIILDKNKQKKYIFREPYRNSKVIQRNNSFTSAPMKSFVIQYQFPYKQGNIPRYYSMINQNKDIWGLFWNHFIKKPFTDLSKLYEFKELYNKIDKNIKLISPLNLPSKI